MACKLIALLAILAVAVSVTVADHESYYTHCQMEVQEQPLNSCQNYLEMLIPQRFRSWESFSPSLRAARSRCCQELRYTSPECRCQAVRQAVRDIWAQQGGMFGSSQQFGAQRLRARASQLTSVCGMSPQHCRIQMQSFQSCEDC